MHPQLGRGREKSFSGEVCPQTGIGFVASRFNLSAGVARQYYPAMIGGRDRGRVMQYKILKTLPYGYFPFSGKLAKPKKI